MTETSELLSRNPNSKRIYDVCEKHFLLGDLAIFQAATAHSLKCSRPVSTFVIAPSGQFKSTIGQVVIKSMPKLFSPLERFTEFGIIKHPSPEKLNKHTWYLNDFVRTVEGMSDYKVQGLLSFLAVLMSDGKIQVNNYQHSNIILECRMNLIGNIAFVKYSQIRKFVQSSTFYERVFEYWYSLSRNEVREKTEKPEEVIRMGKYPLRFASSCKLPVSLRPQVQSISDSLAVYGYDLTNMRVDNLVEGWLMGHAMFNHRTTVNEDDVVMFEIMKKHLAKLM